MLPSFFFQREDRALSVGYESSRSFQAVAVDFGVAIFFWLLVVYGISNAIAVLKFGQLYIHPWTDKIPVVRHAVRCVACASMWVGALTSWFLFSPASLVWLTVRVAWPVLELPSLPAWKACFVDGAVASAVSYLLWSITEWLVPTPPESVTGNASHLPDAM